MIHIESGDTYSAWFDPRRVAYVEASGKGVKITLDNTGGREMLLLEYPSHEKAVIAAEMIVKQIEEAGRE